MKTIVTHASVLASLLLISTTAMADPKHNNGRWHSPIFNNRGSQSNTYCNNNSGRPSRWAYPSYPDYRWTLDNNDRYPNRWSHSRPYGQYSNRPSASSNDPWIHRGILDGRLSPAEVRELRQDQWEIRKKEASYLRDGRLTERERESLEDERSDYRDQLEHELNDGERRY